ncbi:hypothetical protein ACHQM5_024496 [Ranunculus cassubicifolius]
MGQCSSSRSSKDEGKWKDESSSETTLEVTSEAKRGWLALVRERRSRFYIVKKCVIMLIRWNKYGKY